VPSGCPAAPGFQGLTALRHCRIHGAAVSEKPSEAGAPGLPGEAAVAALPDGGRCEDPADKGERQSHQGAERGLEHGGVAWGGSGRVRDGAGGNCGEAGAAVAPAEMNTPDVTAIRRFGRACEPQ
jgi:hypothetical protein